jgi:hypothetical protein
MTVQELINLLKNENPEMEVYFAHPSHDYWRSELASPIEIGNEEYIKHSQYHNQMTTIDEEKWDPEDGNQQKVIIFR